MKTYPLEELFVGQGSKYPFRAQWWKPGAAAHLAVFVFISPGNWETEDGRNWGLPIMEENDTWILPWSTQPVIKQTLQEILLVS